MCFLISLTKFVFTINYDYLNYKINKTFLRSRGHLVNE